MRPKPRYVRFAAESDRRKSKCDPPFRAKADKALDDGMVVLDNRAAQTPPARAN